MAENNITKEQLKEELAKAQAELEAVKQAKEELAKAKAELETAKKAETAAEGNDPKRRVQIKLFKDNGKYKEPLMVSVNEYTALIQRGVPVDVPYYVAMHIREIEEQDAKTAMMISELADEFASKAQKL